MSDEAARELPSGSPSTGEDGRADAAPEARVEGGARAAPKAPGKDIEKPNAAKNDPREIKGAEADKKVATAKSASAKPPAAPCWAHDCGAAHGKYDGQDPPCHSCQADARVQRLQPNETRRAQDTLHGTPTAAR